MAFSFSKLLSRKSLSVKLLRYVFGLYCAAAVLITIVHLTYDYSNIKERMRQSIILYQNALEKTITKEIWHLDRTKNRDTMEGILRLPFIVGASVHLADESVFTRKGELSSTEVKNKLWDPDSLPKEDEVQVTFSDDLFVHSFDLYDRSTPNDPVAIGHVHFYSSSVAIINQLQGLFISIVVAALFKTAILWVIFILVANRILVKPLSNLVDVVRELPLEKTLNDQTEETHRNVNELELLEGTIMHMSVKLNQTLQDLINESQQHQITENNLQDVNEKMEIRIKERTQDLETTNKNLISEINSRKRAEEKLAVKNAEISQALKNLSQAQSTILQQEKMASIGQLAAGVAHEINNPTGFIISNLGTLLKYLSRIVEFLEIEEKYISKFNNDNDILELKNTKKHLKIDYIQEDAKDLIDECLDGSHRIQTIVENLKGFSRLDDNKRDYADINDCLDKTLNVVWNELKYNATINKDYGDLPMVHCVPMQLNQVFLNLLVNASHAIAEKGEITIKTWKEIDLVKIAIEDNGCGIPEDKINRIFEPFFTTKEVGKGTGLGLSISYDIIKNHAGEIVVESNEGSGTTFTIMLPITESPLES